MNALTIVPSAGLAEDIAPFEARHLIGGAWRESADGAVSERRSPAHGVLVSRAAKGGAAEADAALDAARRAFDDGAWPRTPGKERAALLSRVASLIDRDRERIALLETLESGKPISQARAEIDGAADIWRYAAAQARMLSGESQNTLGPDILGMVLKEPVGVVSAITPWNFPFLIASQKLPFALAAGCTVVLKPSELTPSTTVVLGELILEAGAPPGVVNLVLGFGDPVGAMLSSDPRADMVTFTGSTAVGKAIVRAASGTLKKVSLELGGKNPQVVFPDADLESAADALAFGALFNAGECCNAGSRLIAHRDIAETLLARTAALAAKTPLGDPLDPRTQVGAIITPQHLGKIDGYVKAAAEAGAELPLGGAALPVPGCDGAFYAPTIVAGVAPGAPIAREEVFGPVLAAQTFETLDQALSLANDGPYGLSAGVWSENVHTCLAFVRGAEAGTVWTNTWMDGFPELPFGGMKESGLGRELGRYGVEEYLEAKTVTMRIGRTRTPWVAGE